MAGIARSSGWTSCAARYARVLLAARRAPFPVFLTIALASSPAIIARIALKSGDGSLRANGPSELLSATTGACAAWLHRSEEAQALYDSPGFGERVGFACEKAHAVAKIFDAAFDSLVARLGLHPSSPSLFNWAERGALTSIAEKIFPSRSLFSRAMTILAAVQWAQRKDKMAITVLERALATVERTDETDSYWVGMIAKQLALYYAAKGNAGKAEDLLKRVIRAFESRGDLGKDAAADSLYQLALLYATQGRYSEEADTALRSIRLLGEATKRNSSTLFEVLNTLGGAYYAQGRYADAKPHLLRAGSIAYQNFAASDPRLSRIMGNLAVIYKAEGRYIEAVAMFNGALQAAEIALGPDDLWVGAIANRLAVTYYEHGADVEAEQLFRRAIAIGEKNAETDGPFLSASLFNLSALYARQGRYGEGKELVGRSLAIRLRIYGPGHPAVKEAETALLALEDAQRQKVEEGLYPESAGLNYSR